MGLAPASQVLIRAPLNLDLHLRIECKSIVQTSPPPTAPLCLLWIDADEKTNSTESLDSHASTTALLIKLDLVGSSMHTLYAELSFQQRFDTINATRILEKSLLSPPVLTLVLRSCRPSSKTKRHILSIAVLISTFWNRFVGQLIDYFEKEARPILRSGIGPFAGPQSSDTA